MKGFRRLKNVDDGKTRKEKSGGGAVIPGQVRRNPILVPSQILIHHPTKNIPSGALHNLKSRPSRVIRPRSRKGCPDGGGDGGAEGVTVFLSQTAESPRFEQTTTGFCNNPSC